MGYNISNEEFNENLEETSSSNSYDEFVEINGVVVFLPRLDPTQLKPEIKKLLSRDTYDDCLGR